MAVGGSGRQVTRPQAGLDALRHIVTLEGMVRRIARIQSMPSFLSL
jgi:hypothetical protein